MKKERLVIDVKDCQIKMMHIHVLQDMQRFLKKAGYEIDVTDITEDILKSTETETGKDWIRNWTDRAVAERRDQGSTGISGRWKGRHIRSTAKGKKDQRGAETQTMKSGLQSTEFWLTCLSAILITALVIANKPEGIPWIAGLSGMYTAGRTVVKATNGNSKAS